MPSHRIEYRRALLNQNNSLNHNVAGMPHSEHRMLLAMVAVIGRLIYGQSAGGP